MNLYGLTLIFLFALLVFIFSLKGSLSKKIGQRSWIERLEMIAKDNHALWSMQLPFFQNNRISEEVQALEKKQKEGLGAIEIDSKGEWSSDQDLLKYPTIKKLFRRLMPYIESYSQMIGLDSKNLTLTAWANVQRNQNETEKKQNEDAVFSGCYFIKGDPKHFNANEGISFFKKGGDQNLLATFSPEPGDFLLFPSDMLHQMGSYQNEQGQISIAFNVHFGNRKKSWMLSKLSQTEEMQKIDPFHELSAEKNIPQNRGAEQKRPTLFHISQIKRKFTR